MSGPRVPLGDRQLGRDLLLHAREESGLTQEEVAERARISATWYRAIEGGQQPSLGVTLRIAEALNKTLDDIAPLKAAAA